MSEEFLRIVERKAEVLFINDLIIEIEKKKTFWKKLPFHERRRSDCALA